LIIERVELSHVRNVKHAVLELSPGLNLLVGSNGAGKTAVLEALHILLRGRSFRTARISSVIEHEANGLSVRARCDDSARGHVRLGVTKTRNNQTELRVDGQSARQTSAVAGLLPVQLMLPDLAELVFGGPRGRRQWLDWGTFHVKPDYLGVLRDYGRVLRQRNSVLRSHDRETLKLWTSRLTVLGEAVTDSRRAYIASVRPAVYENLERLAPDLGLALDYYPGWSGNSLSEELGTSVARDVKLGTTQAGPHRADISLKCGDAAAANVLSRGQGKAAATALRIGQAQGLVNKGTKQSLFLIDDVWAERDDAHSKRFFDLLGEMGCQIVATSASEPEALETLQLGVFQGRNTRLFHVKHGKIEQL
jgi:DNA replication and repair protein RecF